MWRNEEQETEAEDVGTLKLRIDAIERIA